MKVTTTYELLALQKAGHIAAQALNIAKRIVKVGMTTLELDKTIQDAIYQNGGLAAFKGHEGYKYASCISINADVVHGVPSSDTTIHAGDLVSIDTGAICNGHYSDAAISFVIPPIHQYALRLVNKTEQALKAAIQASQPYARIGDISRAIQQVAGSKGIIKNYTGHCIGRALHELPKIPNEMKPSESEEDPYNFVLEPGMVIAIEPMFCLGTGDTFKKNDGWTVTTTDNTLSAHCEHTVLITLFGPVVLTELK